MPLVRFIRLPRDQRRALARAAFALVAASAAIALLPFRLAIGFGSGALGRRRTMTPDDCVRAVETVARRLPWRTVCIQKGIAVQRLLRNAGVDAILHYGARRSADSGELEAHVWVTVAGEAIIGGEEAVGLAEIAAFPLAEPTVAGK